MHPRTKFLLGGVVVLGAAGVLLAGAIKDTGIYFLTPGELHAKVAADPTLVGTGVKVGAKVVPGSVVRHESGREVAFQMTDGQSTYPVVYRGIIPDTFSDSVEVVVEGRLDASGTFQATTLLAKCASRYEEAPEGYKAARAAYDAEQPAPPSAATPSAAPAPAPR
jgi:cytochrome c-type biogenesis protein CcmE